MYKTIAFILLLGAAACGRSANAAAGEGPGTPAAGTLRPTRAAVDSTGVACPSSDFSAFLAAFAEDPAVQRAWTRFPLEQLVVVDGVDEPTPVERSLTREQATFPLLPDAAQRIADSLNLHVEDAEAGRKRVVLAKPDTDWTVTYIFVQDGCWQLVRIEDWSL